MSLEANDGVESRERYVFTIGEDNRRWNNKRTRLAALFSPFAESGMCLSPAAAHQSSVDGSSSVLLSAEEPLVSILIRIAVNHRRCHRRS